MTIHDTEHFDIVGMAFGLSDRISRWTESVRWFFYEVVLSDRRCPSCDGRLAMVKEGQCRCQRCSQALDPTPAFQRCGVCGGQPVLRIRRYACSQCGLDVPSRFLFDGLVFDSEYFREKMAESRQRREDLRQQIRDMLASSRSLPMTPVFTDLGDAPGLVEALNGLTMDLPSSDLPWPRRDFDLSRYQNHLQAHIGPMTVTFDQLPLLSGNQRQDRIWRFVALLFMAQAGIVDLWQEGSIIMVKQHDSDTEGPGVSGETEAAA